MHSYSFARLTIFIDYISAYTINISVTLIVRCKEKIYAMMFLVSLLSNGRRGIGKGIKPCYRPFTYMLQWDSLEYYYGNVMKVYTRSKKGNKCLDVAYCSSIIIKKINVI